MANGMEIMMGALMKSMPPEILENIANMGKTIVAFKEQLDRIEAKLDAQLGAQENGEEIRRIEGGGYGGSDGDGPDVDRSNNGPDVDRSDNGPDAGN